MSNELALISGVQLPAYLKGNAAALALNDNIAAGIRDFIGLQALTMRGKVWRMPVNGKEVAVPAKLNEDGMAEIDVVMIAARPCISKRFYGKPYDDKAEEQPHPDCFSLDGILPDASIAEPVNGNCATCPKNAFGSGKEGRGKACTDYKRIAAVLVDRESAALWQENGKIVALRLDLPPTSLRNFKRVTDALTKHNMPVPACMVALSLDPNETHQVVTFKFVGILPEERFHEILDRATHEDVVAEMNGNGVIEMPRGELELKPTVTAPKPVAAAAPTPPPPPPPVQQKLVKKEAKVKAPDAPAPVAPAAPAVSDADKAKLLDELEDMGKDDLHAACTKLGILMPKAFRSDGLRAAIREHFAKTGAPKRQVAEVANDDDDLEALLSGAVE